MKKVLIARKINFVRTKHESFIETKSKIHRNRIVIPSEKKKHRIPSICVMVIVDGCVCVCVMFMRKYPPSLYITFEIVLQMN